MLSSGNPKLINEEHLLLFKENGVNRISLGIQSFNNKNLDFLNRSHNKEEAINAIKLAKKYFDNVNIDLIYALPNQTLSDLKNDLDEMINLKLGYVASILGRFWSLDREENWDRIEKTYNLLIIYEEYSFAT